MSDQIFGMSGHLIIARALCPSSYCEHWFRLTIEPYLGMGRLLAQHDDDLRPSIIHVAPSGVKLSDYS